MAAISAFSKNKGTALDFLKFLTSAERAYLAFSGKLITFTIGGISGVFLAVFPVDWQLTDSYYVVAHMHYVAFGGSAFATGNGRSIFASGSGSASPALVERKTTPATRSPRRSAWSAQNRMSTIPPIEWPTSTYGPD